MARALSLAVASAVVAIAALAACAPASTSPAPIAPAPGPTLAAGSDDGSGSGAPTAPNAHIEAYLARGQKLFDNQDYKAAIQSLAPVTRDVRATRAERLRALELSALAELITDDKAAARSTFERILDIDPGYQLADPTGSPKIRAFFEQLKKEIIPGYDATAGADLEHAAPSGGTAGHPIELEARVTRGNVFDVVLSTRRRGELAYHTVAMAPRGDGRWRGRVVPDASSKPYVLEYFLAARDAGGATIGRVASPDAPLELALAPGSSEAKAWYARWYVIGGAAAAAAIVTGVAVTRGGGASSGTLPPGTITVTH